MALKGLEALDGQLLDGLEFCTRVYGLFDEVRAGPKGIEELRMFTTVRAKKLIEELLPLAAYIQARHGVGLRLQIRWLGGNQTYDAYLKCSGMDVVRGIVPARQFIEVTTSSHANEYLVREHLNRTGGAFGPRATTRDAKTRQVVSKPSVYSHREAERELMEQVTRAIAKKAAKRYPPATSLLVRCVVHMPILDDEWRFLVDQLRKNAVRTSFREIVLWESLGQRVTLLSSRRRKYEGRPNKRLQPPAATPQ